MPSVEELEAEIAALQKIVRELEEKHDKAARTANEFCTRMTKNLSQKEVLWAAISEAQAWFDVHPNSPKTARQMKQTLLDAMERSCQIAEEYNAKL